MRRLIGWCVPAIAPLLASVVDERHRSVALTQTAFSDHALQLMATTQSAVPPALGSNRCSVLEPIQKID